MSHSHPPCLRYAPPTAILKDPNTTDEERNALIEYVQNAQRKAMR